MSHRRPSSSNEPYPLPEGRTRQRLVLPRRQVIRENLEREHQASLHVQSPRLQKQLQDANEEIRRLKDELQRAREPPPPCPRHRDEIKLQAMKALMLCCVCGDLLWDPFVLECGHVFCQVCLRKWFSTILAAHVIEYPSYDPRSWFPTEYLTLLHDSSLEKGARCDLLSLINQTIASTSHPSYTCPCCRAVVNNAPISLLSLKSFVHDMVGGGLGTQTPAWEDFLPFNARELVVTQQQTDLEDS
ncbi:hypothetical protein LXA43DRAFT_1062769 [Ganoderma leucocontextum]|nr:hypothetical protein LXA43DRAFT_1062762 [Ganoderma leucocontextum]KAI1789529.1 hypothetical protein LXA43DRAFT_1062769 [Ganoderma leucocontextum]